MYFEYTWPRIRPFLSLCVSSAFARLDDLIAALSRLARLDSLEIPQTSTRVLYRTQGSSEDSRLLRTSVISLTSRSALRPLSCRKFLSTQERNQKRCKKVLLIIWFAECRGHWLSQIHRFPAPAKPHAVSIILPYESSFSGRDFHLSSVSIGDTGIFTYLARIRKRGRTCMVLKIPSKFANMTSLDLKELLETQ